MLIVLDFFVAWSCLCSTESTGRSPTRFRRTIWTYYLLSHHTASKINPKTSALGKRISHDNNFHTLRCLSNGRIHSAFFFNLLSFRSMKSHLTAYTVTNCQKPSTDRWTNLAQHYTGAALHRDTSTQKIVGTADYAITQDYVDIKRHIFHTRALSTQATQLFLHLGVCTRS
jgi:hypothetical protein